MKRRFLLSSAALAFATLGFASLAQDTNSATETPAETEAPVVTEMVLGSPDAKVEIIEYASFTCPHCASFHEQVFGQLKTNYIDTGKVRFVNREVYFDRFGLWAGMVARCGGDTDRYFGLVDMIFEKQREWIGDGQAGTISRNLRTIGKTAGLTDEMLDQCLNDQAMAEALIANFQENMNRDEIQGTPTFLINGEKYSNMSYAEFSRVIDEKLAE